MSRRHLHPVFIVGTLPLIMVASAMAQPNYQRQAMQQQRPQRIKTGGTLVSASQSQIQITTNTNQSIMVMIGPNTTVNVTGTAEQDYLKSPVTVEFVAEVAKGGTVAEKISHLVVVSPSTDRPAGFYPPETAVTGSKGEKGGKPGADNANAAAADPGIADPTAKKGKARGAQADDVFGAKPAKSQSGSQALKPPGTFAVRGTIKSCKDGKISLSAGRSTIKAELAADATIDVDMSDLRAVQRDDKVTVNGLTTQARPNMVLAESIKIELANPLSGTKKHAARPAKAAATESKPKKPAAADATDPLGGGKP
jgi:hypothetical protein